MLMPSRSDLIGSLRVASVLCSGLGWYFVAASAPAHEVRSAAIGAATVDITPNYPVRLTGYGNRQSEHEGVAQPIRASALAVGDDGGPGPAVWISVENCGITPPIRDAVAARLRTSCGVASERLAISVTHTHTAPCLPGWATYIFGEDMPPSHKQHVEQYGYDLVDKLVAVAERALAARCQASLWWGRGQVGFAANRRVVREGAWTGFGEQPDGPVDHALRLLVAKDTAGRPVAVVANYACHCTTLTGQFNQIAGDWAGFAAQSIEADLPGCVALVTIGCGADANPSPRGEFEQSRQHGRAVAEEVRRLLEGDLVPIDPRPECRLETVQLPLEAPPTRDELIRQSSERGPTGFLARSLLARIDAGETLPRSVPYAVGTWTFGSDLAVVLLAGEVVVDYQILLSGQFDDSRLWVTAYTNDVPCYIPSRRILREGGYEADRSMTYYGQPTRFAPEVEATLLEAVDRLLPAEFRVP